MRKKLREGRGTCEEHGLHAGGGAGGDKAVGSAEDDDETVGDGHAGARHVKFEEPFELFGELCAKLAGVGLQSARFVGAGSDTGDGAHFQAVFPVKT